MSSDDGSSDDDLVERYVAEALELRAQGRELDLRRLCREHPELVERVEQLLALGDTLGDGPREDPLVGVVLDDRYELRECVGIGAMGAVHVAFDRTLGRRVAVKLLQSSLFASAERHARFAREARVLASLRHPHIVSIHDHGRTADGLHYIAMELLDGAPLSRVLRQAEADVAAHAARLDGAWLQRELGIELPGFGYLPQVVRWCAQVAEALACAHAAGVTHRDVKPSNVFVDRDGKAVLLDFGIAAREGEGTLTALGSTLGSPWYMAPEQAVAGGAQTPAVDVYGLCATLYHLATLRPPYEGDYAQVLPQLQHRDPAPPARVRRELSRDLCAVIEKGMERDPARRYGSMQELADDLHALNAQLPVRARPISAASRAWRRVRRRPTPWLVAVLLMVAVGVTVPTVSRLQERARAREAARFDAYFDEKAALAPSVAFEGELEARPDLPADERADYLARLARILELRPDDRFCRLVRSALLLDQGDLAASTADVQLVLADDDTPFARAFVQRYRAIDTTRPGVLGLDLDGLPEARSDLDRLMLGFQLYRRRQSDRALAVLEGLDDEHARNLRLMPLYNRAYTAWRERSERAPLDHLLAEVGRLEREQGGATARTLYVRAIVLRELRDWVGALATFEQAHELCPSAYGIEYGRGVALARLSRIDDALVAMRRARALRPANVNGMQQVAMLLAEHGRFDEALREVDALPTHGHTAEPWQAGYVRGYVLHLRALDLYGRGDVDAAIEAERGALEHYQGAIEKVPAGSYPHRVMTSNCAELQLLEIEPIRRVEAILDEIRKDPTSGLHVAALRTAIRHCGDAVHEDLQASLEMALELWAADLHARAEAERKAR